MTRQNTRSVAWRGAIVIVTLVLGATVAQAQGWTSPLGIPAPPFGTQSAPPAPASWPSAETAGMYYVDNKASCSDSRTYGTPNNPRCSFPSSVPAGARVEVHGGPYSPGSSSFTTSFSSCTAASPCWFIGVGTAGTTSEVHFDGTPIGCNRTVSGTRGCVEIRDRIWNVSGGYFVIDGFYINRTDGSAGGGLDYPSGTAVHHMAFRNSEITRPNGRTGACVATSASQDVVFWRNSLHDCGDHILARSDENDVHGVQVGSSQRVWIVDNAIYHNGGDGIQPNAGQSGTSRSSHTYIGRNHIYENGENALDIKTAQHVIFSENVAHGYVSSAGGGGGDAIVINDENQTPTAGDWHLFFLNNLVYDSVNAFRWQGVAYIFGNVVRNVGNWCFIGYSPNSGAWVENNTCHQSGRGFSRAAGSGSTATLRVRNNLFTNMTNTSLTFEVINAGAKDPGTTVRNNLMPTSGVRYDWDGSTGTSLASFESASGGKAVGNIAATPAYVNVGGGDFRLATGSAGIDQGTSTLTSYDEFFRQYGIDVKRDRAGNVRPNGAWDIGAYEGAGGTTTPPPPAPAAPTNVRIIR